MSASLSGKRRAFVPGKTYCWATLAYGLPQILRIEDMDLRGKEETCGQRGLSDLLGHTPWYVELFDIKTNPDLRKLPSILQQ